METVALSEIRKSLQSMTQKELVDVNLRLARYKKENKELLSYILYFPGDEEGYIRAVKEEIEKLYREINRTSSYYAMKGIRKTLRSANKYIRYSGKKSTEVELLIYFCIQLHENGFRIRSSTALSNLYDRQILKIRKAISTLHEDLQFDYNEEMKRIDKSSS
jgi:hypothetical protein